MVVGELVGFKNILSASRMNKAMVVLLKTEQLVNQLTESGIWIKDMFVPVTPLAALATKVPISNVLPFISNNAITKELTRFGKIASPVRMIPLGCKNAALKHVLSFRRQVLMSPECTLEIWKVKMAKESQDGAEDGSRVASSGKTLQFFVCSICFFVVLRVRCC